MNQKGKLARQKDEFTLFAIQLAHDACAGIYRSIDEYPIDGDGEEQIRFYAEILYCRGLWKPLQKKDYPQKPLFEEASAIYRRWIARALDRVCDEYCVIMNEIIDTQARSKAKGERFFVPNFFTKKKDLKEKISTLLSEEVAIHKEKQRKLALNY